MSYPDREARPPQGQNSTSPSKAARVIQSGFLPKKKYRQENRPCVFVGRRALLLLCVGRLGIIVSACSLPFLVGKWLFLGCSHTPSPAAAWHLLFVCGGECGVRVFFFFLVVCKFFCVFLFLFLCFIFLLFVARFRIFVLFGCGSFVVFFLTFLFVLYGFFFVSVWCACSSCAVCVLPFGLVGRAWLLVGVVPFVGAVGVGFCGGVFVFVVWCGSCLCLSCGAVCGVVLCRAPCWGFVGGVCSCGVAFGCGCSVWFSACSCCVVGFVVGGSSSWCFFFFCFVGGALWLLLLFLRLLLLRLFLLFPLPSCPLWAGRVWWGSPALARLFLWVCRLSALPFRLVRWLVLAVLRVWTRSCGLPSAGVRCFRRLRSLLPRGRGVWSCALWRWCGLLLGLRVVRGVLFLWFFPLRLVLRGLCRLPRRRCAFVVLALVRGLRRRLRLVWVFLWWCLRRLVFPRGVFPRLVRGGSCCLLRRRCSSGGLLIAWGTTLAPASLVSPPHGARAQPLAAPCAFRSVVANDVPALAFFDNVSAFPAQQLTLYSPNGAREVHSLFFLHIFPKGKSYETSFNIRQP